MFEENCHEGLVGKSDQHLVCCFLKTDTAALINGQVVCENGAIKTQNSKIKPKPENTLQVYGLQWRRGPPKLFWSMWKQHTQPHCFLSVEPRGEHVIHQQGKEKWFP